MECRRTWDRLRHLKPLSWTILACPFCIHGFRIVAVVLWLTKRLAAGDARLCGKGKERDVRRCDLVWKWMKKIFKNTVKSIFHTRKVPSENRHTAVTGRGMPTGTKNGDRTRTRVTLDHDTAVIPVHVLYPRQDWVIVNKENRWLLVYTMTQAEYLTCSGCPLQVRGLREKGCHVTGNRHAGTKKTVYHTAADDRCMIRPYPMHTMSFGPRRRVDSVCKQATRGP